MKTYTDPQLEVVSALRDEAINASIQEIAKRDRLTQALAASVRNGVSIDNLSEASGLTCEEIRRRIGQGSLLGEDMDALVGLT